MTVHLFTVPPWEVEPGDRLLGLNTIVARVLYDGRWLFIGPDDVIFAARSSGLNVQVLRGTVDDTDDGDVCPPWGIPRPGQRLAVIR